eukprot:TRINITY_DN17555_c0_g1_i2.p1 TRINITY_DN17555_c0_g1~~TRINITY_DN17555_c0_g1_i2.p1  ORF type:complete len:354 (-),score=76.22 TRINITY_DN17555_c0_g1_i2:48-1109(-)
MAEADETTFRGVLKKLLTTQYVIECAEVMTWYGVDARMPADLKPEGVELGDPIVFGVKETKSGKPLVEWAEAEGDDAGGGGAKRPAEEEVTYTGVVEKQSVKTPVMYFIKCAEVDEWYGSQAKISEEEMPEDVDVGDTITFTLMETEKGFPRAVKVQKVRSAKRPRTQGKAASGDSNNVGEVRFGSAASAEQALEMNGMDLEGVSVRVEPDKMSHDGTKVRVYGIPDGCGWQNLKDFFSEIGDVIFANVHHNGPKGGKGGGKAKGRDSGLGFVRFRTSEGAEEALTYDGTEFEGSTINVEMDPLSSDYTKVKITGLPPGTGWQALKDHFSEAGEVAHAGLGEDRPKGKGKGKW